MDYQAQQAARQVAAKALQAANPHLVPVGDQFGKNDSLNAAAKNIRIQLKRAFPGVKFSVKTSRYSGGDSIDVRWTDGPNDAQVDEIIDAYKAGSFDGMQDLYEYQRNAWTDAFGDAKYIHSCRDASDAALAACIRTVKARYASNFSARGLDANVADYKAGKYWNVDVMEGGGDYWCLQNLIRREFGKRTWCLNKTPVQFVADEVAA